MSDPVELLKRVCSKKVYPRDKMKPGSLSDIVMKITNIEMWK